MASHAVRRLLDATPAADGTTFEATLELQCGCRVVLTLPEDRLVERPGGERFAVGKVPCPAGHPVVGPSSATPSET
jgi:hypothetical protein